MKSRQPGFTLIELLVALLVVSVGLGVAVLAMRPDTQRQLATEGQRLDLLFTQARDEAVLGARPLAWMAKDAGYLFLAREVHAASTDWRPLTDDELLRERHLPEGMRLTQVWVDGRPLSPGLPVALSADGAQRIEVQLELGEQRLKTRWDASPAAGRS